MNLQLISVISKIEMTVYSELILNLSHHGDNQAHDRHGERNNLTQHAKQQPVSRQQDWMVLRSPPLNMLQFTSS
jgi:hypothetical protein